VILSVRWRLQRASMRPPRRNDWLAREADRWPLLRTQIKSKTNPVETPLKPSKKEERNLGSKADHGFYWGPRQ